MELLNFHFAICNVQLDCRHQPFLQGFVTLKIDCDDDYDHDYDSEPPQTPFEKGGRVLAQFAICNFHFAICNVQLDCRHQPFLQGFVTLKIDYDDDYDHDDD